MEDVLTSVENIGNPNLVDAATTAAATKLRPGPRKPLTDDTEEDELIREPKFAFNLEEKLSSERFNKMSSFLKDLAGSDLTIGYFQKEGFENPILVKNHDGLGLVIPPNLTVHDVRTHVGSRRYLDVMDVATQKNIQLTMKEFNKYWDTPPDARKQLLNVISLEFSNTKLDPLVISPRIVRQIDWIDKVWPRHLKEMQIESTNSLEDMMFPKVQKYCLMSVKGCWTDFHIDLGGTSVWYHILQGRKVFWLIPPTDENLRRYEQWILSSKQSDTFFGDVVENCARIEIQAGNTFFIPSGWIHAVATLEDSIVFGGNFLHSFGIEKQLQVAHIEEVTHVPHKFRFPFFTEMLWYTLDRYVHCLTGVSHLDLPEEEKRRIRLEKGENIDPNKDFLKLDEGGIRTPKEHVHLTQAELDGIKYIVMYLHHLPASKKNVPIMLPDPIALVKNVRQVVLDHLNDCPDAAVTGKYVLRWTENDDVDAGLAKRMRKAKLEMPIGVTPQPRAALGTSDTSSNTPTAKGKPGRKPKASLEGASSAPKPVIKKSAAGNRRRRVRCKNCDACNGEDCRQCSYCKDMVKYGGPGRMKQTCEKRRCLHPQLPICAYCCECKLDGWYNEPKLQVKENEKPEEPPKLYECSSCLSIMHPDCAEKKIGLGKINPDLSNSWECAKCLNQGYSGSSNRQKLDGGPDPKKFKMSGDA